MWAGLVAATRLARCETACWPTDTGPKILPLTFTVEATTAAVEHVLAFARFLVFDARVGSE